MVASIGITQVMAKRNAGTTSADGDQDAIFVAQEDIPYGEPLNSQVLRLEQWPKDKIPAGALSRIEDIEGRRPRTRIYAGEPILENKLWAKGAAEGGVTHLIPPGYRLKGVKVDQISGGGLMLPGDRVDVMIHLLRNPALGIPETSTRTILYNIKVFAVNDVIKIDESENHEDHKITAKTVQLLVTPEQASMIMLAEKMGTLQLVMRPEGPEGDAENRDPVVMTPDKLFGPTDGGDRTAEEMGSGPAQEGGGGILEMLKAQAAKQLTTDPTPEESVTAPATAKAPTWPIRVVLGDQVEDVLLEMDTDSSTEDSESGFWKPSVPSSGTGPYSPENWTEATDPDTEEEADSAEEESTEEESTEEEDGE